MDGFSHRNAGLGGADGGWAHGRSAYLAAARHPPTRSARQIRRRGGRAWVRSRSSTRWRIFAPRSRGSLRLAVNPRGRLNPPAARERAKESSMSLTHLEMLEAESIQIMREVVAETERPVMLYSIGKDSGVMLHLARKAFYPAPPPFPMLHVDTTWKFKAMYEMRDRMAKESGMELLVHKNPDAIAKNINPFTHGSAVHTDVWKTEGLKQALDKYAFDAAFGGARRDEEKSRAKERIFSFRSAQHRWDPKNQRPELWRLYNTRKKKGESIRVFPLSNWTELDVWQYIYLENIPIVPLYYAAMRPIVERDGALVMVDDERMPLRQGEKPQMRQVRFRTLGCYPLTGAVESSAETLPAIIREMMQSRVSERQGRMIDHDSPASMEQKKQEGYF
ncbi:MAG TPA: sulfate adenylyltransferase subunit CysD [Polyangiaceae bacterium]|nr:sulfate adenylyltransferase subunit CysD [Polyangiaceae bacterium]